MCNYCGIQVSFACVIVGGAEFLRNDSEAEKNQVLAQKFWSLF